MVAKDKGLLADWLSKANVIEIDQSSALVDYIAPWTIDAQNTQEHSTTLSAWLHHILTVTVCVMCMVCMTQ